jgi:hypothetical protein
MRAERTCLIASVIVLCMSLPATAQDVVADFYRAKQVTIMVGFTPGGSSASPKEIIDRAKRGGGIAGPATLRLADGRCRL